MSGEGEAVREVPLEELKAGLADGSITLVDVREPHEFAEASIPGSVSHPLSCFDPTELPRAGRVVFSCRSGVRSVNAIHLARAAGLPLSEHYPGGMNGWLAADEPVDRGDA